MADATYVNKIYREQGGDRMVVKSGGSLDVESGGEIDIESGGSLKIAGVAVTATAAEINAIAGGGLSAAELAVLDGVVAGTVTASKAVVVGTNKEVDTLVIADSGLKLGSGAGTAVTATAAELNLCDDAPASISFAAAAGAANVCEVTITVKDAAGVAIDAVHHLDVWLSDAATGAGLTGTAASGTVQAKAASGTDLSAFVAKKALRVQTLATGIYILEITDTGKTGFYVCAANPMTGKAHVSAQLVTGDYGA